MLWMETRSVSQEEWNEIVRDFEDLSLAQTWEYAETKERLEPWKTIRHLFWQENEIVGAAQGLLRTIPFLKKGLVWLNRAPLWRKTGEKGNRSLLEEMLRELKKYWINEKKMYLRIAAPLLDSGENQAILKRAGLNPCNPLFKWASELIDLTKPEEELRKRLRGNWRNGIDKAERLGVSCEFGNSPKLLSELVSDYKKLLQNRSFSTPITPEFINVFWNLLPNEQQKMWLFAGRHNSKKLGSILIACYGHTCTYFVAAVNEVGRKYNAGQFLLWRAICEMKKLGYRWFDVGGTAPERTPSGVIYFKQGMRGEPYKLVGEFESYPDGTIQRIIRSIVQYRRKSQLSK